MKAIPSAVSGCNPSDGLSPAMQAIHARLVEFIRAAQEASPFEHQNQIWAKPISLLAWCKIGGFALSTLKKLIGYPPIRRMQCNLPGGKVVLLRVGDPGEELVKATAKRMQAFYPEAVRRAMVAAIDRERLAKIKLAERLTSERRRLDLVERANALAVKRTKSAQAKEVKVPKKEFGALCGLARDLPDGWQVELFKHAVFNWPDFMDIVKAEIDAALSCYACGDDPFAPGANSDHMLTTARRFYWRQGDVEWRVYPRPYIPLLRAFWPVAVELFVDHRQRYGGEHPERIWQRWCDPAFCRLSS